MKDFFEEYGLTAIACVGGIMGLFLLKYFMAPNATFAQLIGRFIDVLIGNTNP